MAAVGKTRSHANNHMLFYMWSFPLTQETATITELQSTVLILMLWGLRNKRTRKGKSKWNFKTFLETCLWSHSKNSAERLDRRQKVAPFCYYLFIYLFVISVDDKSVKGK